MQNLIFIPCLTKKNYEFSVTKDICSIYHDKRCVGYGLLTNNVNTITMSGNVITTVNKQNNINAITNKWPRDSPNSKYVGHLWLGHIGKDRIAKLSKDRYIDPSGFEPT